MSNPYQSPTTDVSTQTSGKVTITDIDIPFGRLIVIMLKSMLASIPAILVLYAILGAIVLVIALVFGGLGALMGGLNPEALGQ